MSSAHPLGPQLAQAAEGHQEKEAEFFFRCTALYQDTSIWMTLSRLTRAGNHYTIPEQWEAPP
jgi:hypothetical protein